MVGKRKNQRGAVEAVEERRDRPHLNSNSHLLNCWSLGYWVAHAGVLPMYLCLYSTYIYYLYTTVLTYTTYILHYTYIYSMHAFKRSAMKRRIAFQRSATSATQLLFPIQLVMLKRRIAVSGASSRKPWHSASWRVYCTTYILHIILYILEEEEAITSSSHIRLIRW